MKWSGGELWTDHAFDFLDRAMDHSNQKTEILVIGYGNTLRSDDGVGPRTADAIKELEIPGVSALACPLLTPELAEPLSNVPVAVFVDAAADGVCNVKLSKLEAAESSQVMAHATSPSTLLAIARDVFGHTPEAWLLIVPTENLQIGEDLSPLAQQGMNDAVEEIQRLAKDQLRCRST
jgi:hydrogenase maturation protease